MIVPVKMQICTGNDDFSGTFVNFNLVQNEMFTKDIDLKIQLKNFQQVTDKMFGIGRVQMQT